MNNSKKVSPEDVMRWFRQGIDTAKIAYLLRVSESVVANALAQARENERNQDNPALPAEREQTLEND